MRHTMMNRSKRLTMNQPNQPHDPPGPAADAENLPSQFGPLEWSVLEAIWNGGTPTVTLPGDRPCAGCRSGWDIRWPIRP